MALDGPQALLAGLGREILEFRVDGSPELALAGLRERRIARDDAFAVGARVTVPLHEHAVSEALAAIESQQLRASEIATRRPTLDDVYLQLTGNQLRDGAASGHATGRPRVNPAQPGGLNKNERSNTNVGYR